MSPQTKIMPRYDGFPIIPGSELDKFDFGAITEYEGRDSHEWEDVYCVAPDGSRSGIAWSDITCKDLDNGDEDFPKKVNDVRLIKEKEEKDYWGLYHVYFPGPVRGAQQLTSYLHAALPQLQVVHEAWKKRIA